MDVKEKESPRKWEMGDTFYVKIENNKKYKGRYLIFTKVDVTAWRTETCLIPIFLVKITPNKVLPTTKEEIDKLEPVKTDIEIWENRFLPMHGNIDREQEIKEKSKVKFYPDEYGYLFSNRVAIVMTRKSTVPEEFKYLGNFMIELPKEEFVPFTTYNLPLLYKQSIEDYLLRHYEFFNLKTSPMFSVKTAMERRGAWRQINYMVNSYFESGNKEYSKSYNYISKEEVIKKVKEEYKKSLKNNSKEQDAIKETYRNLTDYLVNIDNMPIVFTALAEQQLKRGMLLDEVKKNALESIEVEEELFKDVENYSKRKKELERLKNKIMEYEKSQSK